MLRWSRVRLFAAYSVVGAPTPNPNCYQFRCSEEDFLPEGFTCDVPSFRLKNRHPLAAILFEQYQNDVRCCFIAPKYITITKFYDREWNQGLERSLQSFLGSFLFNNEPLVPDLEGVLVSEDDTAVQEGDSEVVQCIKELVREQVRPMVQRDGGDVKYLSFGEDTGIVRLGMLGACANCPSSQNTLKDGIERLLVHWLPEVKSVEEEKNRALFSSGENALFKDETEVLRVIDEFENIRQEEFKRIIQKRTPVRASYEELSAPGDDDDDD